VRVVEQEKPEAYWDLAFSFVCCSSVFLCALCVSVVNSNDLRLQPSQTTNTYDNLDRLTRMQDSRAQHCTNASQM
jgi:hypothetical protein